jgi:hypothetical protein
VKLKPDRSQAAGGYHSILLPFALRAFSKVISWARIYPLVKYTFIDIGKILFPSFPAFTEITEVNNQNK